jgi:Cys-rich protein (TIGR01571 family)
MAAGQRFYPVIRSQTAGHNVPVGRCAHGGGCHSQCCLTVWCYPCALGQVLHRNKLNVCASHTRNGQYPAWSAFKIFFGIVVMVYLLQFIIGRVDPTTTTTTTTTTDDPNTGQSETTTISSGNLINWIISMALVLFCFLVTMRLHSYIRHRYSIPGSCCGDCCWSFWCLQCTICQLARHTAGCTFVDIDTTLDGITLVARLANATLLVARNLGIWSALDGGTIATALIARHVKRLKILAQVDTLLAARALDVTRILGQVRRRHRQGRVRCGDGLVVASRSANAHQSRTERMRRCNDDGAQNQDNKHPHVFAKRGMKPMVACQYTGLPVTVYRVSGGVRTESPLPVASGRRDTCSELRKKGFPDWTKMRRPTLWALFGKTGNM